MMFIAFLFFLDWINKINIETTTYYLKLTNFIWNSFKELFLKVSVYNFIVKIHLNVL